jgi:predicted AAA+ superfamily ATPase
LSLENIPAILTSKTNRGGMMREYMRMALVRDNPWLTGAPLGPWLHDHVPRKYIPRRVQLRAGDKACLVVGPRQAGKSTLIWKTLADAGRPVLVLNCEDPAVREWLSSPAVFLAELEGLTRARPALLFEEAQRLPEAGLFLKGVVDRRSGLEVFATGSSSFDLEARTRESLAGRATRHRLLPFSLAEIGDTLGSAPILRDATLAEVTRRMLVTGCFPAVYRAPKPEPELAELVEAFVVRDASDRFRIQNLAAFRTLLELMASQVGNLVNVSEWASLAGVSSGVVTDWAELLEQAHVVRLVRPFIGGRRAELTHARKAYFVDNGVRNQVFGGLAPAEARADRGALLENLVLAEIRKTVNPLLDQVCYWRSKSGAEVDFVIQHQGRLAAVEVKWGEVHGVSRSARSFLEAYQPEHLWLVSLGQPHQLEPIGPTTVSVLPPWRLADELLGFLGTA